MVTNSKIPTMNLVKNEGDPLITQQILSIYYVSGSLFGAWNINVSEVDRACAAVDLYK